jgi:transposase
MYVAEVPNRNSRPAILLRESYREDGKVKNRTLANLTDWPTSKVTALRAVLKGATSTTVLQDAFEILRSRPHGPVAAALGTLRSLQLDSLIAPRRSRQRDLCVAMIVGRILNPRSKLFTAQGLSSGTLRSTLGETLDIEGASEDELYAAMDWLLPRQQAIEAGLAKRHLQEGGLVMYDLTSTYFEGRHCSLARRGYSRDGHKDKLQIVFGLLTDGEGRPVAVEVFTGNTADPNTIPAQVQKLRERFALQRVVLVADRGMITNARIEADLAPQGLDWITALRAPAVRKLVESGALDMSLFDDRDLAEILSPDYPGERLIVCRNPLLAAERARKRRELLEATEKELDKVVQATQRAKRALRGKDNIGLRVGRVLGRFKMGKHFHVQITDTTFRFERRADQISQEAALDGIYVIRTTLPAKQLSAEDTVRSYKRLSRVERAFRSLKTVDLKVRPIYHHLPDRVRAHVLLCTLAYYVEWHMRRALAPLLFDDEDHDAAQSRRSSVVAPAQRSLSADQKAFSRRTAQRDLPVQSFQALLGDLATLAKNRVQPKGDAQGAFDLLTTPTPLQQRAFKLLKVRA